MTTATVAAPWHGLRTGARAVAHLGGRQIRNTLRQPAEWLPAMLIPLFFYFVQSASLTGFARRSGIPNYEAFVLPVAILFATTNEGVGFHMVEDIERGYFDKLALAPVSRLAIILGAMGANFVRVLVQALVVSVIALATGTVFETGVAGMIAMVLLASLWGVAFAALGIGVALRTANSQAVQGAQVVVFPLLFLTTSFAPKEALTDWLQTAVTYNPMTYILEGMRAFATTGDMGDVLKGLLAVVGLGAITITFALRMLRARLR